MNKLFIHSLTNSPLSPSSLTCIKECNVEQLIGIMNNDILPQIPEMMPHKDKINESFDSVTPYDDNLTCDIIGKMRRDKAINSWSMTHEEIQKTIIENKIAGPILIDKFQSNTNQ